MLAIQLEIGQWKRMSENVIPLSYISLIYERTEDGKVKRSAKLHWDNIFNPHGVHVFLIENHNLGLFFYNAH